MQHVDADRSWFDARRSAAGIAVALLCAVGLGTPLHAETISVCLAPGGGTIPDGAPTTSFSFVVAPGGGGAVVAATRFVVSIDHPWVGDLRLVLRGPDGTSVVLLDRPGIPSPTSFPGPWGCGGDDLDVAFDDAAPVAAESSCELIGPAIGGDVRPADPLAAFVGRPAAGTWVLEASDLVGGDAGSVLAACLELVTTTVVACPADLDGSGDVGGADLAVVLGAWGSTCAGCAADLSGDGAVDGADLAIVLGAWGPC
jgi:subtilisin-like proprotein convertase family protein